MLRTGFLLIALCLSCFLVSCTLDPGIMPKPSVSIQSHQNGDTAYGPYLSIAGTAADSYGLSGVYVELDGGGFHKATGLTRWSTNYPGVTNGPHTVRAFARNFGGVTSPTNTVTVTVTTNTNWYDWTVMVYLCADNNLEYNGLLDFNEMEAGILDAVNAGGREVLNKLAVIVIIDRIPGYTSMPTEQGGGDWTGTRLYRILPDPDMAYFASERLDRVGSGRGYLQSSLVEENLGHTNVFRFFLEYVRDNFTAKKYSLIMWDHGTGARSMCQDWTSDTNALYIDQIRQTIAETANAVMPKIDMIGFDACFMGLAEVAYEFRGVADVMVASMRLEDADGWDYQYAFGQLAGSRGVSAITAETFASLFVEGYREWHESRNHNRGDTLSAVDLSHMPALKTGIDALAAAMHTEGKKEILESIREVTVNYFNSSTAASIDVPHYDLYDFCNRIVLDTGYGFSAPLQAAAASVINTLSSAVILAYGGNGYGQTYYYGPGSSVKRGLSWFFSRGNLTYTENAAHPLKTASGTQSHFWFQWWYTAEDTQTWWGAPGYYYGRLDFCDTDTDGTVQTWRELLKAWYDPSNNVNTPGAY